MNISADNGAHQVVSGPAAGIEGVSKRLQDDGIRVRRLNTTRAFHSALVEPALPDLEAVLRDREIGSPAVTLVSNLTGRPVGPGEALDGAYWRRHAREPVAFAQGVGALGRTRRGPGGGDRAAPGARPHGDVGVAGGGSRERARGDRQPARAVR